MVKMITNMFLSVLLILDYSDVEFTQSSAATLFFCNPIFQARVDDAVREIIQY